MFKVLLQVLTPINIFKLLFTVLLTLIQYYLFICFLNLTLTKCGSLNGLLKERLKKANIVMRQVWGTAERKFKDDFKRRMMMFDSLALGVMMYGIELIGWKESAEMERIQLKYIKWTLRLDRCRLHSFGGDK